MTTQMKMSISENITIELALRRRTKKNEDEANKKEHKMLNGINYILIIVSEQTEFAAHYNGTLSLFRDLNRIQWNQSTLNIN